MILITFFLFLTFRLLSTGSLDPQNYRVLPYKITMSVSDSKLSYVFFPIQFYFTVYAQKWQSLKQLGKSDHFQLST